MSTRNRRTRPDKHYTVRAIHRPTPDVQRLTELVIRLAIQRRDNAKLAEDSDNPSITKTRKVA